MDAVFPRIKDFMEELKVPWKNPAELQRVFSCFDFSINLQEY